MTLEILAVAVLGALILFVFYVAIFENDDWDARK